MSRTIAFGCVLNLLLGGIASAQFAVGGVYVDAEGVVRRATRETGLESPLSPPAANTDVTRSSPRRIVSLARLERELSKLDGRPSSIHRALAGLNRIDAVHLLPDDVLLTGPAEGWIARPEGEVVGATSGRPVVRLDDLSVALQSAFAEKSPAAFGCSIDPTREGLERVNELNRRLRSARPSDAGKVALAMQRAIGLQAVRVFGVPADSPFALGLVAADVKLKRIAMGHEPTGIARVPSYVDLVGRSRVAPGGLLRNRFWFVAHYEALRTSSDGRAFAFVGSGLRLLASPPSATGKGAGEFAAPGSPAGRFTKAFNDHIDELIAKHPEFAGLQNRIALAVAAELIARPHFDETNDDGSVNAATSWSPARWIDPKRSPVSSVGTPRHVPSLAGVQRTNRGQAMIHVSGGVSVSPMTVVDETRRTDWETASPRRPGDPTVWWWDAQESPKVSSKPR